MFRKSFLSIAALALTTAAYAGGGEHNNTGCNGQGNPNSPCAGTGGAGGAGGQGGAGGTGVGVGIGIAGALANATSGSTVNSDIRNTNSAVNTNISNNTNRNDLSNSQGQGQMQGQQQSNRQGQDQGQSQSTSSGAQSTGGTSSANGQGSGNKTLVNVDASTSYERSAPAIAVGGGTPLPTGCRYVFGIGGSNANGSVGASGIPLWKDSECMGAAVFAAAGRFPGVFTVADLRQVACENFTAMENTPTCKTLKEEKRVEGIMDRDMTKQQLALLP